MRDGGKETALQKKKKKKTSVKVTCKEREEALCGAADSRRAQLAKLIGKNEWDMPVNGGWRHDLRKSN